MDNKDLEWISNVVDKLQVPQTHNERQRLTKILVRAAPAFIKVLDYTAIQHFVSQDKDGVKDRGHTCNACGQDHYYKENNPKHRVVGAGRDVTGGETCCYVKLLRILEEEEKENG